MFKRALLVLLALLLFQGLADASYVKHFHIWWYENGDYKDDLYISPDSERTIYRDPGTRVDIRIFKTDSTPATVDYFYADINNGNSDISSSSDDYYTYLDCLGPLDTKVIAGINDNSDALTLYVYNIVPQNSDLVVSHIEVDGSTTPRDYEVGEEVKVDCIVWNQGEETADSSRLGYYFGTSESDTRSRWDSDSVGSLDKDKGSAEYEYYTFEEDDIGTKYFIFMADYRDDVDEGDNEDNNIASFGPFNVVAPPNTCPTLNMTQPSSNQSVTKGDSVTISWDGTDPDDAATVSIGYDEDNIFDNGNHHWIALGKSEDDWFW